VEARTFAVRHLRGFEGQMTPLGITGTNSDDDF
jgi:hypothetical protein